MAIPKGTKQTHNKGRNEIELVTDAWPRFEKFIRELVKSGPQHRVPPGKPKEKAGKSHKQKKGIPTEVELATPPKPHSEMKIGRRKAKVSPKASRPEKRAGK